MDYAIIKLGNKQHCVRHGETLVVDRLATPEGDSFEPVVLLGVPTVTATVIAHERGPKILIGKYRKRTGYKRHNGFRAATSRVEISLGAGAAAKPAAKKTAPKRAEPAGALAEPAATDELAPEEAPAAEPTAAEAKGEAAKPAPKRAAAPEAAEAETATAGLPQGYESMTVAQIGAAAKQWSHDELDAAVAYEQQHAARKGALAALESARTKEDG